MFKRLLLIPALCAVALGASAQAVAVGEPAPAPMTQAAPVHGHHDKAGKQAVHARKAQLKAQRAAGDRAGAKATHAQLRQDKAALKAQKAMKHASAPAAPVPAPMPQ